MNATIRNDTFLTNTNEFVYKRQAYPFNYLLFKSSSGFFAQNLPNVEQGAQIQLIDQELEDTINLKEESIRSFIKFVHLEDITLNIQNACELNYLANRYQIQDLIQLTRDFIFSHIEELFFDYCKYGQHSKAGLSFDEDAVRARFLEFIEDERMLDVSTDVVERLFSLYYRGRDPGDKGGHQCVVDFLFRQLERRGAEGSRLFEYAKYEAGKEAYVPRLMSDVRYRGAFDFRYVGQELYETLVEARGAQGGGALEGEVGRLREENERLRRQLESHEGQAAAKEGEVRERSSRSKEAAKEAEAEAAAAAAAGAREEEDSDSGEVKDRKLKAGRRGGGRKNRNQVQRKGRKGDYSDDSNSDDEADKPVKKVNAKPLRKTAKKEEDDDSNSDDEAEKPRKTAKKDAESEKDDSESSSDDEPKRRKGTKSKAIPRRNRKGPMRKGRDASDDDGNSSDDEEPKKSVKNRAAKSPRKTAQKDAEPEQDDDSDDYNETPRLTKKKSPSKTKGGRSPNRRSAKSRQEKRGEDDEEEENYEGAADSDSDEYEENGKNCGKKVSKRYPKSKNTKSKGSPKRGRKNTDDSDNEDERSDDDYEADRNVKATAKGNRRQGRKNASKMTEKSKKKKSRHDEEEGYSDDE